MLTPCRVCWQAQDMFLKVTRDDFEFEVCPLFDRCMAHVRALLLAAHVTPVTSSNTPVFLLHHLPCLPLLFLQPAAPSAPLPPAWPVAQPARATVVCH